MAYFAPYVGAQGFTAPIYADILGKFIAAYLSSNGASTYLGTETSDYQLLSLLALAASDAMDAARLAYNQRSILTAVGAALDAFGVVFATPRKVASYSTVPLVLTGTIGAVIANASARDTSGVIWYIPTVTISNSGSVTVTATCSVLGSISAPAGSVTKINGGIVGWQSVTNPVDASIGQPTETDSQYRGRLIQSTAINAQTLLAGTRARLAALPGVSRVECYENFTNQTDANGTPAHSLTCVVEGGSQTQIGQVIAGSNDYALPNGNNPSTSGSTSVTVTDSTGAQSSIGFYRPTYVPVYVTVNIKALAGYTSQVAASIQANLVMYLNSLRIGQPVTYGELFATVYQQPSNAPTFSTASLYAGTSANPSGQGDIAMAFYQTSQGLAPNIVVNVS